MAGLWVRNGLQIKGQAMTYIQCHFCKSMIDADIYLLQVISTQLPPTLFISSILDLFHVYDWLSLSPYTKPIKKPAIIDPEQEVLLFFEIANSYFCGILQFSFADLFRSPWSNLVWRCWLRFSSCEQTSDWTKLPSLDWRWLPSCAWAIKRIPCCSNTCRRNAELPFIWNSLISKFWTFENWKITVMTFSSFSCRVLKEVAQFREPQFEVGGTMQQGMYLPRAHVWEELFDPLYVLLRSVHRRDFQSAIDRFSEL